MKVWRSPVYRDTGDGGESRVTVGSTLTFTSQDTEPDSPLESVKVAVTVQVPVVSNVYEKVLEVSPVRAKDASGSVWPGSRCGSATPAQSASHFHLVRSLSASVALTVKDWLSPVSSDRDSCVGETRSTEGRLGSMTTIVQDTESDPPSASVKVAVTVYLPALEKVWLKSSLAEPVGRAPTKWGCFLATGHPRTIRSS